LRRLRPARSGRQQQRADEDVEHGDLSTIAMAAALLPIKGAALLGAIDQMTVLAENTARLHVPRVMERFEKARKKALPLLGKRNDRGGLDFYRWK
jgi:hypothetical protein